MGKRHDNAGMHRKIAIDYAEMLTRAKRGQQSVIKRSESGHIIRKLADVYHLDARTVRRAVRRYPEITSYQPLTLSILRNVFGALSRQAFRSRDRDGRDDEGK